MWSFLQHKDKPVITDHDYRRLPKAHQSLFTQVPRTQTITHSVKIVTDGDIGDDDAGGVFQLSAVAGGVAEMIDLSAYGQTDSDPEFEGFGGGDGGGGGAGDGF